MTYLQDIEQQTGLSNTLLNINDIQSFAQLPLSLPNMVIGGASGLNNSVGSISALKKSQFFPGLEPKLQNANRWIDKTIPFVRPLAQTIEAWEAPLIGGIVASKLYDTHKKNQALWSNRRYALPIAQSQGYDPNVIQEYSNNKMTASRGIKGVLGMGNTGQINAISTRSLASYNQFAGALSNVNTILKIAPDRIKEYGKSIRELTEKDLKNSVKSTEALAAAYEAASAGFTKAKDNQNVMVAGLKLAKAGAADSGEVMRLLTQTMNTYGASANEASTYAAKFNNIVEKGITTVSELSNSLGETAVVAKSAGVNINEIGAAIATMTTKGMGTSEANTALQGVLMTVIDKTPISAKTIRELNKGIENDEDKIKLDRYTIANDKDGKGLIKELQKINRVTKGNSTLAADVFSSMQAYKGYTTLMNDKGKTLDNNFESMKSTVSSKLDEVFGIRVDNQNEKFNKIFNRIEESYIKMGEKVEPFFDKSISSLEDFVDKITKTSEKWSDLLPYINKLKSGIENFVGALANITKTIVGGLLLYNMARMGGLIQSVMSSASYITKGKDEAGRGLGARLQRAGQEVLGINQLRGQMIDPNTGQMQASDSAMYNRFRMSQARNYATTWLPPIARNPIEAMGRAGSSLLNSTGLFGSRFNTEKRADIFRDKEGDLVRVVPNQMDSSTGTMHSYYTRPELLSQKAIDKRVQGILSSDDAVKLKTVQAQDQVLTRVNQLQDEKLALKAASALSPTDPRYIAAQNQIATIQSNIATKQGEVTAFNSQITGLKTNTARDVLVQRKADNLRDIDAFKIRYKDIRDIESEIKKVDRKIRAEQGKANPDPNALTNLHTQKTQLQNNLATQITANPNYIPDKREYSRLKGERNTINQSIQNIDAQTAQQTNTLQSSLATAKQELNTLNSNLATQQAIVNPTNYTPGVANRVFVYDAKGELVEDANLKNYKKNIEKTKTAQVQADNIREQYKSNKLAIKDLDNELKNTNLPLANKYDLEAQKKELEEKNKKLVEERKKVRKEEKGLRTERKAIEQQSPLIRQTPYATALASQETPENAARRQLATDNAAKVQAKINQDIGLANGTIPSNIQPIYTGVGKVEYKQVDADTKGIKYGEETAQSKIYRERTEQIERQLYGNKRDIKIAETSTNAKAVKAAEQRLTNQIDNAKARQGSASPTAIISSFFKGFSGRDYAEIADGRVSNSGSTISDNNAKAYAGQMVRMADGTIQQAQVNQSGNMVIPSGATRLTTDDAKQELQRQSASNFAQSKQRLMANGMSEEEAQAKVARVQNKLADRNAIRQWTAQENARTGGNMTTGEARQLLQGTGQRLQVDASGKVNAVGAGQYNAMKFANRAGKTVGGLIGGSGIGSMLAMGVVLGAVGKVGESVYDLTSGSYAEGRESYKKIDEIYEKGLDSEKIQSLEEQFKILDQKRTDFNSYIAENKIGIKTNTNVLAKQNINKQIASKKEDLKKSKGAKDKEIIQQEILDLEKELSNVGGGENLTKNKAFYENNATKLNKEAKQSERAIEQINKNILDSKEKLKTLTGKEAEAEQSKVTHLENQKSLEEDLLRLKKDSLAILKGEEVSQQTINKTLSQRFSGTQSDAYSTNWKDKAFNSVPSLSGNGFANGSSMVLGGGLGVLGSLALGTAILGSGVMSGGVIPLAVAAAGAAGGLGAVTKAKDVQSKGKLSIYDVDKYAEEFGILGKDGKRVRQKNWGERQFDNTGDFLGTLVGDNSGAFEDFFNEGIVKVNKGTSKTEGLAKLYETQTYGQLQGYKVNEDYKGLKPLTEREEALIQKKTPEDFDGLKKGFIEGAIGGALVGGTVGIAGGPVGMVVGAATGAIIGGATWGLGKVGLNIGEKKEKVKLVKKKAEYEADQKKDPYLKSSNLTSNLNNLDIFGKNLSDMSDKDIKTMKDSIDEYNNAAIGDLQGGLGKQVEEDKAAFKVLTTQYENLAKDPKSKPEMVASAKANVEIQKGKVDSNEKVLNDQKKLIELSNLKIEEISTFKIQADRNKKGIGYIGQAALEGYDETLKELGVLEDKVENSAKSFTQEITTSDIKKRAAKDKISEEEAKKVLTKEKNDSMNLLGEELSNQINSLLSEGQGLYESGKIDATQYSDQITELLDGEKHKYLDTGTRASLLMQKVQLEEAKGQEKANLLDLDNQILEKRFETGDITQLDYETTSIDNQVKATQELIDAKTSALKLAKEAGTISKTAEQEALKEIELLKATAKAIKDKGTNLKEVNDIGKQQANLDLRQSQQNIGLTLYGFSDSKANDFRKNLKDQSNLDQQAINLKISDYTKQVEKTGADSLEARKLATELAQLREQSFGSLITGAENLSESYKQKASKYLIQNSFIDQYSEYGIESSKFEEQKRLSNINKSFETEKKGIDTKYQTIIESNKTVGVIGLTKEQKENKQNELEQLKLNQYGTGLGEADRVGFKYNKKANTFIEKNSILEKYNDMGFEDDYQERIDNFENSINLQDQGITKKYAEVEKANKKLGIKGLTQEQRQNKINERENLKLQKFGNVFNEVGKIEQEFGKEYAISGGEIELLSEEFDKGNTGLSSVLEEKLNDLILNKTNEAKRKIDYITNEFNKLNTEVPNDIVRQNNLSLKQAEKEASQIRDQIVTLKDKPVLDKLSLELKQGEVDNNNLQADLANRQEKIRLNIEKREVARNNSRNFNLPDFMSEERDKALADRNTDYEIEDNKESKKIIEESLKGLDKQNNLKLKTIELQKQQYNTELKLEKTTQNRRKEIEIEIASLDNSKKLLEDSLEIEKENLIIQKESLDNRNIILESQKEINKLTEKGQSQLKKLRVNQENILKNKDILSSKNNLTDSTIGLVQDTFGDNGTGRDLLYKLLEAKEKSLEKQYGLEVKLFEIEQQRFIQEQEVVKLQLQKEAQLLEEKKIKAIESGNSKELETIEKDISINKWSQEAYQVQIDNAKALIPLQKQILESEREIEEIQIKAQKEQIAYTYEGTRDITKSVKTLAEKSANQNLNDIQFKNIKDYNSWLEESNNLQTPVKKLPFYYMQKENGDVSLNIEKTLAQLNNSLTEFNKLNSNLLNKTLGTVPEKNNKVTNTVTEKNSTNNTNNVKNEFNIKIDVVGDKNNPTKTGENIGKVVKDNITALLEQANIVITQS